MEKIKATLIFEILGRPKEHIVASLEEMIKVIAAEKGVHVSRKKIHEAKLFENKDKEGKVIPVPEGKELYSTFAEVDIETDGIIHLMAICFKYMPAHVEVTEPTEFNLNNYDFNLIINEIAAKLHQYDAIAKTALMQNEMLARKFHEMSQSGNTTGLDIIEKGKSKKNKKSKKSD